MIVAAIYARRSTEQNGADADARSVVRQIENARAFAAARGWTIAEQHVYADDAVSGADVKRLVNRQRLLDAIRNRPPFDVLIMRDASRFSRRDGDEAFGELKRIAQAGVKIWFYADQTMFEFGTFAANITGIVRAEMNAEYRRQIAKWTKEAMLRKARAGHVTGGRVFGYDNVDVMPDGRHLPRASGEKRRPEAVRVERRINEEEAAVVVRIFEMAAAGAGFKRISKRLNDERVPSPRAQQGRPHGWAASSIRPVLFRTLYRGVITWGKSVQRDESGAPCYRRQPPEEWLTVPVEHLRIVPDTLWQAAHARIAAAAAVYFGTTDGRRWGHPAVGVESKYLLSGLSTCACCGSGLMAHSVVASGDRRRYYVCTGFHNKGRAVCANGLPLPMPQADDAVLSRIRRYVLAPEVVEGALADALAALRPNADAVEAQRAALRTQLHAVNEETERLVAALAAGGQMASLIAALRQREDARTALERQLTTLDGLRGLSDKDVRGIERDLRARVQNWRALLGRQAPVARQIVATLLDGQRLVFAPREDRAWTFKGRIGIGRLLEGIVLPQVWRPQPDTAATVSTPPFIEIDGLVTAA